jgi:ankyrin repeat protein
LYIEPKSELAIDLVGAIQTGDLLKLKKLLAENPGLSRAIIGNDKPGGEGRTLLHIATDWPGFFPNAAETIRVLVEAGADVNARMIGPHAETPLHWAASSGDLDALDALLDCGADIEAPGAVIGGGTPLADAVGFGLWDAARRLVERGAKITLGQAAALGMMDHLQGAFDSSAPPPPEVINHAFWYACHGGQREAAEFLLDRGADINWIPGWERKTPLDAASRHGFGEVVEWLRGIGGKSAHELMWKS